MCHARVVAMGWMCAAIALLGCGCGKKPPPVTQVEGTLLLNNEPLPFALVEFFPELTDFGAELNSSAVTDEKGRFTLTHHTGGQPGAVVATHRVVVVDAPPPPELRGQQSQSKLADYVSKLKNRPIPGTYGNYSQTPLRVEVTSDKRDYMLHMTR